MHNAAINEATQTSMNTPIMATAAAVCMQMCPEGSLTESEIVRSPTTSEEG